MTNIFLSHSSYDRDNYVNHIANTIRLNPYYTLWNYDYRRNNDTMDEILKNLSIIDLFVVFISNKSLESYNVQQEIIRANDLYLSEKIRKICPIMLDKNINPDKDSRVLYILKPYYIRFIESPEKAILIIKEQCMNLPKKLE